jgi:hypothetical protein
VVVARDGGDVAGVLALFGRAGRSRLERLRLMGAPMAQGTGPAGRLPGREAQVAGAFAQALADVRGPRPATLELEECPGRPPLGRRCCRRAGRAGRGRRSCPVRP